MELVQEGFKQTEVGLIPGDWDLFVLSEISSLKGRIGWQGLKKEEFTMNASHPYLITGMNFKDGEIRWDEVYHVPQERYEIAKDIQLREGDVLMTKDGTIGKLLFVNKIPKPGKATLNSHLLLFRPIRGYYNPKYLYYNLHTPYFKRHIDNNKSGTTFFGISQESVAKYLIPLPPTLKEQKAIATALSDVDALISSLDELIAKKKAIKQGAMQQLLTPPSKGGKRLPGFDGEWEETELQNFCEIKGGGTPSTNVQDYWNGAINWFTPTEIGKNKYVNSSSRKITDAGLNSSSANLLPSGSILLTTRASIGDAAILSENATTNQGFQSLVPKSISDNEYLYQLIKTKKKSLIQLASGSTFLEISPKKVKTLIVDFPKDTKERKAIAEILSDMDVELEQLEAKKAKYQQIKQGMMQELLTGKTRLV